MNQIVNFRLCTLTDKELVDKIDVLTDEMYKTGKMPTMHIPARPNEDYDLLVGELVYRFNKLIVVKNISDVWFKVIKDKYPDFDIIDADGWDRTNFKFSWFEEKIDYEEFKKRLFKSTIITNTIVIDFITNYKP